MRGYAHVNGEGQLVTYDHGMELFWRPVFEVDDEGRRVADVAFVHGHIHSVKQFGDWYGDDAKTNRAAAKARDLATGKFAAALLRAYYQKDRT